mmetsp:Transcript_933/g.2081  ORF Transcript_933/g.2081 Transcript_933/m.2081 type:complete len:122 (-) Transcript_933:242-607(-)
MTMIMTTTTMLPSMSLNLYPPSETPIPSRDSNPRCPPSQLWKQWGTPSGGGRDDYKTAPLMDLESTTHSLARDIMDEYAMDEDAADAPSNCSVQFPLPQSLPHRHVAPTCLPSLQMPHGQT